MELREFLKSSKANGSVLAFMPNDIPGCAVYPIVESDDAAATTTFNSSVALGIDNLEFQAINSIK
jgi:hypothetical protein